MLIDLDFLTIYIQDKEERRSWGHENCIISHLKSHILTLMRVQKDLADGKIGKLWEYKNVVYDPVTFVLHSAHLLNGRMIDEAAVAAKIEDYMDELEQICLKKDLIRARVCKYKQ